MMTVDRQLEHAIRQLLDLRDQGATITPRDAARHVGGPQWRSLVKLAHNAAHRMTANGEIELTVQGKVVDDATPTAPVRIRRSNG